MNKSAILFSSLALGLAVAAGAAIQDPAAAAAASSVGVKPAAVQTFGDAHYLGNAHWTVGTGAACSGAPTCLSTLSGCASGTTRARSAYVGSFIVDGTDGDDCGGGCDDGNDLTTIAVWNGADVGKNCSIRLNNAQNFVGHAVTYTARVLRNLGSGVGEEPGAEGVFKGTTAFGPYPPGTQGAIITEAHGGQGPSGSASVSTFEADGGGPSAHLPVGPTGAACGVPPYLTFDRTLTIPLNGPSGKPAKLTDYLDVGASYTTDQYLCTGGAAPTPGTTPIQDPLYVAIYATFGSGTASGERLQDGLSVDNIISLHGDCDFAGDPGPAGSTFIELVCD